MEINRVFFDRRLLDAAIALEHATGLAAIVTLSGHARFHHQVFLTPPWPEIHHRDSERGKRPQGRYRRISSADRDFRLARIRSGYSVKARRESASRFHSERSCLA
ncbi:AAA family ATPase [Alloyangia pacifica]|uniref:AAA family ATPase n=1 Tax=Alloyangia pacifica TaxID=311180 RepID=UPI003F74FBC5